MQKNGIFIISLDFELFWGIRDKYSVEEYGANVLGVWEVIPKLIELFARYDIHATFATVGALFSENKLELNKFLPSKKPGYFDSNLSPYNGYIEDSDSNDSKLYFGKSLIQLVKEDGRHEIGTHTFSHYYALESGQNAEEFESDLQSALSIANEMGIDIKTLIFPRHQINEDYLPLLKKNGIMTYRGTEKSWYHSPSRGGEESILKRIIRYADYYMCLNSHHCQDLKDLKDNNGLYRIRASRWLRPYKKSESKFDFFKIRRIKKQMNYAAKNGKIFHLWFHPHDIGINQDMNFSMLEEILKHYKFLLEKYNIKSMNMMETINLYKNIYER